MLTSADPAQIDEINEVLKKHSELQSIRIDFDGTEIVALCQSVPRVGEVLSLSSDSDKLAIVDGVTHLVTPMDSPLVHRLQCIVSAVDIDSVSRDIIDVPGGYNVEKRKPQGLPCG